MNNLCLQRVEVSFYNVARSLTLLFNVLLGACILGSSTTLRTKGCLSLVVAGFFLGTQGELNYSLSGSVFGVLSSLPLTHNISGTAKAAVQSALAFYIWGNTPTVKGVLGMLKHEHSQQQCSNNNGAQVARKMA
eukprot:3695-Heterococcus_DN1.PRE.4